MNFRWRQTLLAVLCCFVFSHVFAHIKNEASQFPDIEFSESRFDIVVLIGAGIIPETPVFEPDKLLSMQELASWASDTSVLGNETPDTKALAAAALEQGLVDSLDGDASYADVNALFFNGQLNIDNPERTLTKAAAASFIAAQLSTEPGLALLRAHNVMAGVTGQVSAVEADASHTYVMTINDTKLPMSIHGRVANGPVDLMQWQGRIVKRSFVRGEDGAAEWAYLEAEPIEEVVIETQLTAEMGPAIEQPATDRSLLYGLIALVVLLGLALFYRHQRNG
jgi:hypothetical protein